MLTKDEVNGSFDIALSVELVTDLSQEGVLIPIKTNTIVSLLGAVSSQSNGLRSLAVSVLDVDVVEGCVCGFVDDCSSGFIVGSST